MVTQLVHLGHLAKCTS